MSNANSDEEDFQYWLAHMDDALEAFFEALPAEIRAQCDYSVESLDAVEGLILERYASIEAIQAESEAEFIDGVARYLGETYRKNLGGGWTISYDNPKDINYGLPVLDLPGWATRFCPLRFITTARDRGTGVFWRTILSNKLAASQAH